MEQKARGGRGAGNGVCLNPVTRLFRYVTIKHTTFEIPVLHFCSGNMATFKHQKLGRRLACELLHRTVSCD